MIYGKAGGLIELAFFPRAGHGYAREGGPNTDRTLALMKSFIARQFQALDCAKPGALDKVADDPAKPLVTCSDDGDFNHLTSYVRRPRPT